MKNTSFILRSWILVLVLIMGSMAGLEAASSKLIESNAHGQIDWEKGTLRADSAQHMDGLIQSLRVDTSTTIGELMLFDPGLVEELPQGKDVDLYGDDGIATTVFGKVVDPEAQALATPDAKAPDGVIVDATLCDFFPCLIPSWMGSTGEVIFAPEQLYSLTTCAVRYVGSLQAAKLLLPNAMIVRAISTGGAFKGSLGFSAADSDMLKELEAKTQCIRRGKVIIIL